MEIPTNATAQSKLFASRGMHDVKRTFVAEQLRRFRAGWALRQLDLRDVGQSLEVIVASVTEMSRPEAEKHGHRTAIATFILKEVHSMFWAHLKQDEINCRMNQV